MDKKLNQMAEMDQKFKDFLCGARRLIMWACDRNARDMLKQAEASENIRLNGFDDDPKRTKLEENVIEIPAIKLLEDSHKCVPKDMKHQSEYVLSFHGALAR